ncbi:beta/alpha barrel domain-containing protein [Olivibacter domesticus]|nr:hydroxymethylglutaryl-CoA lyase [Olivibacter domesticus]
MIRITECPRDAMQGMEQFIPTSIKVEYLNLLLKVGFDRLDFGSFVSPKAIPQLRDTAAIIPQLDLSATNTQLLAIVANTRGALEACQFPEITFLGFPFSVSETFQQRNTNASIETSLNRIGEIITLCNKYKKEPLVYLSMAFGNPYGDAWSPQLVSHHAKKLANMGIKHLMLADTTGVSTSHNITQLYVELNKDLTDIDLGVHLHSQAYAVEEKIKAAIESGCKRFDTAIGGYGGCPMAEDKLTGNMATESLLEYLDAFTLPYAIDKEKFNKAKIFWNQHIGVIS